MADGKTRRAVGGIAARIDRADCNRRDTHKKSVPRPDYFGGTVDFAAAGAIEAFETAGKAEKRYSLPAGSAVKYPAVPPRPKGNCPRGGKGCCNRCTYVYILRIITVKNVSFIGETIYTFYHTNFILSTAFAFFGFFFGCKRPKKLPPNIFGGNLLFVKKRITTVLKLVFRKNPKRPPRPQIPLPRI